MKWSWARIFWVGAAATAAISVGSVVVIDWFADREPTEHLARMGTIGDMFGAAAALFAGLGFIGLIAALTFDVHERQRDLDDRRKARIPYLAATVGDRKAFIDRAQWVRDRLTVSLDMLAEVENVTGEPALNLTVRSRLPSAPAGATVQATVSDAPLGPGAKTETHVEVSARGEDAEALIRQLRAGPPLTIELSLTYSSLTGTQWQSQVTYKVASDNGDDDAYKDILDASSGYEIIPTGSTGSQLGATPLYLRATSVPGSWSQSEVAG